MSDSKCLVDLSLADDVVIRRFSSLHDDFSSFVKQRNDNTTVPTINIIRFIVLCYDKESTLREQYKARWTLRKKMAAKESGLLNLEAKHKANVDDIIYGNIQEINAIIVKYLSLLFDRDFMAYAVYAEILIKQYEQLIKFKFDRPSDAAKAKENVESLQKDLTDLEEKIFGGGDVKSLKNLLNREAKHFAIAELRPESVVSKLEKGERVVDESPYGEDYVIDKMRFLGDN